MNNRCIYCDSPIDSRSAFYGDLEDGSTKGWICDKHIDDIVTIAYLSYHDGHTLSHLYMATRGELRNLIADANVSDIRILKAKINVDSIHDRWKPKKRSEAYRYLE